MDFGAMFQTWWTVLTKPGEATFQEELEKPQATLGMAFIWIVIAAVILAVLSIIGVLVSSVLSSGPGIMQSLMGSDMPPEMAAQMAAFTGASIGLGIVFAFIGSLIFAPLGFLIGSAIYFLIAKVVGGEGSFERHTFALSTFTAPLLIVNGALGIIPVLGACLSFVVYIYQIVLTYFAMKVAHNLTSGKALLVALVPLIIGLICAAAVFFLVFTVFFGILASSGGFD
jgi:hypothetical protein